MAHVIFFEKPGCSGNARQKALLAASGHHIESRNLFAERWTTADLRLYFGDRPVHDWFNQSSPRIKAGAIDPENLTEQAALELMISDPVLIRRPLLRVGDRREAGFDQGVIDAWIGLTPANSRVSDSCVRVREDPSGSTG
jgi:nitrogenase-associated protein